MRQLLASVLFALLATNALPAIAQNMATGDPPENLKQPETRSELCEVQEELPAPSLTEPFAIGEALYDPARVADAVVSMLDLMGVGIDKADGTPLRSSDKRGTTFRLTESEVRRLIAMGRADAAVASRKDRPPYSFKDLHRAVSPLLPTLSIEGLAGAYSEAYEANPDALVPQILMGQPIEPGTRLMRTQIWLLLVDGFVPPGTMNPAPALGSAGRRLPPLPPPNPGWSKADWLDLVPRLPLLAWWPALEIAPQSARAHEGHGGPGAPVTLSARIGIPLKQAAPSRGLSLLKPKTQGLGDRQITWNAHVAATLLAHGSAAPALRSATATDATGTARIVYTPIAEVANGRGSVSSDTAEILATIGQWDLVSARYDVPAELRGFLIGDVTTCGDIEVSWHAGASQTGGSQGGGSQSQGGGSQAGGSQAGGSFNIKIANHYDIVLNMGPLGGGTRKGEDGVEGTLDWQADGTYRGVVKGYAKGTQEVHGLGMSCGPARSEGTQDLLVIGTPVASFGPLHKAADYVWVSGQPDGGWLSLEFFPTTRASYTQRDDCQTEIQQTDDPNKPWFLPYNDAQWTIRHAGYGLAYPKSGRLVYKDNFSETTVVGTSTWDVIVERRN